MAESLSCTTGDHDDCTGKTAPIQDPTGRRTDCLCFCHDQEAPA